MMNREDVRRELRSRLKDDEYEPSWPNEFLDDAIAEAVRRYSTDVPRLATCDITVFRGEWEIAAPKGVNPLRIVRLLDDQGVTIPHWDNRSGDQPPAPGFDAGHIWRTWVDHILLGQASTQNGIWRLEYLTHRIPPTTDTEPLDIEPGDEDVIVTMALAVALGRRAVNEGKKGTRGSHPMVAAARTAQADVERLMWAKGYKRDTGGLNVKMERVGGT